MKMLECYKYSVIVVTYNLKEDRWVVSTNTFSDDRTFREFITNMYLTYHPDDKPEIRFETGEYEWETENVRMTIKIVEA